MGTKSPLLLEEYAALYNKINKLTLTTIGLKTSEEESLEVLIKKTDYDLIIKVFEKIDIFVLEQKHFPLLEEYGE
jgi:hypothetical protein